MPELRSLLQAVFDHPAFRAACAAAETRPAGEQPGLTLSGLTSAAKALVAAGLAHQVARPLIVLTADNEAADRLRRTAATVLEWLEPGTGATVNVLPAVDSAPYEGRSPHPEISERRAVALWNLARGRTRILFVPLAAALGRFREKSYYGSLALELKVGDEVSLEDLSEHLVAVGYEPGEPVESPGQFSLRGGIVDVFPPEANWPFRLEFFGDRIESLREFDPSTQRSRGRAAAVLLLPFAETRRSPRLFDRLVEVLGARQNLQAEPDWAAEYSGPFPGWEFFAPLVEPHTQTLPALMERPLLIWDEPVERRGQLRQILESWAASYDEVRDVVPPRPQPEEIFLTREEFLKSVEGTPQISLQELAVDDPGLASESSPRLLHLATQPPPRFHGAVKTLVEDLRARRAQSESVTVVLPTAGKADRLREILAEYDIPYGAVEAIREPPVGSDASAAETVKPVLIARGDLDEGVVFPDLRLVLLSDAELFGEFAWGGRGRRERSAVASFISDLSDLKAGDYVVHVDHGIGLYQGLRPLEVEGVRRDFMLLTYQDEARLYVPLERLDLVEKYRSSGDGAKPQLDRLGGATWARTKTRVKRALRDIAQELLHLYAERKMHPGTAFTADTPWQKEFEDTFEFEETPDQITSLAEIKRDLETPQPMDRLLCGDVGYGKTELAMRAAFKIVQDSRQVVLLAPTTVLAFQHFATFRQRFAAFPVRTEMLSRFRSAAEQKKIVADAEAGRVDILIGTHRLLSKDVRLRDLGLLIVDEEQRFGVAAKERLRKLKASVDVLTMSATPIPRTLHMSLGGLRDLSVIETPPRGRLAIQTVVAAFSDGLIQSAILQEMNRQGQVFFVHNRVESIWSIAALIQRLVPTARVGVSHGQMGEKELERVMLKFMEGGYDVLVSTALIENGLDIPRANTMIVNRADRFGLADLYQLRGRVGRSNRRAYAYFLIPGEETLTPTAKRRLAALKEFSDLGAGFRLAALDLELRGAGNVLGAEQSGHLNAIGLDLYLKMLDETVAELKGAAPRPEVRTTLNLGLDIKIPASYIADESQRLRMYKRISGLATLEQRGDLEAELTDRYGAPPPSLANLLDYALLKSAAEQLWIQSIERKADAIWLKFHPEAPVAPERLTQFVRRRRDASLRPDGTLRFRLAAPDGEFFAEIGNVLQELQPRH
ncbi:MAG: transcription-repair coupling factor [Acidobacteriia bacterium]|nr:transcription-repair coupling factor [Terriglobia bacterium]